MFIAGLAREHGIICPRFVATDTFFPFAFLMFFHFGDNPTILSILSLVNSLLNGVHVLSNDIVELAKSHSDNRGANLFGLAIIGALRRTHTVAHRIGATVMAPRRVP